jgi:hypothetical protein
MRTWQRKIVPNLVTWSLLSFISFVLLLTYKNAGAEESIWPAVATFLEAFCILLLILFRQKRTLRKLERNEIWCIVIGLLSLTMLLFTQGHDIYANYALYLAIVADACALTPTILSVWKNPENDRPFEWIIFAFGYSVSLLAISESDIVLYIFPLYMIFSTLAVAVPLVLYRIRNGLPLKEWG